MTYLERKELEMLSKQIFGSATRYAKVLKGHYVDNKHVVPSLEEVKHFMLELLAIQDANVKQVVLDSTAPVSRFIVRP